MRRALATVLILVLTTIASAGPPAKHRPIPPSPSASLKEIEAWVAKEYPQVVFNPEGVPAEVWASFFKDFAELGADLPNTVRNITYIGTKGASWDLHPETMMMASGHPGGPYFLSVNPGYCPSLADLKERVRRDEKSGWHVKGSSRRDPTYPLVAHELAHLLELQVKSSMPQRHAQWMGLIAGSEVALVSEYATMDGREAFAEAVVAWHVQDPDEFAPLTKALGLELHSLGIAR